MKTSLKSEKVQEFVNFG